MNPSPISKGPNMAEIFAATDDIRANPVRVPWRKACAECVLRRSNPQNIDAETRAELVEQCVWGLDFYCLHQVSGDGFHQPCASASAHFLRESR